MGGLGSSRIRMGAWNHCDSGMRYKLLCYPHSISVDKAGSGASAFIWPCTLRPKKLEGNLLILEQVYGRAFPLIPSLLRMIYGKM